jgi:hypothetical protein
VDERILGPDDRVTLGARANLALWAGRAGDPAGARDQYAALLPVDERVVGPDHPHTLTARANLAYYTGEAGDTRPGPATSLRLCCRWTSGSLDTITQKRWAPAPVSPTGLSALVRKYAGNP